jgi:hypothetical protein
MELFFDLLHMKPFSQAFIDELLVTDSHELFHCYAYLFRGHVQQYQSFPMTRDLNLFRFVGTLFHRTKSELIDHWHFFDDFLRILIDFIDASPVDQLLCRASNSISSDTLLLYPMQYRSFPLTFDYEHVLRFQLAILDCDTIEQVKHKIVRYFNAHETTFRLVDNEHLDLVISSATVCPLTAQQLPMFKHFLLTSTIHCQKRRHQHQQHNESNEFVYHICRDDQLIRDREMINEKLLANKTRLQPILMYFYQEIANGLPLFSQWSNSVSTTHEHQPILFQQ